MSTGAWVLLVAVAAALVLGGWRALTDGHFRGTHRVRGVEAPEADEPQAASVLLDTPWAGEQGERVTLLQFSSAFCAPCRATRRILADVAAADPGVSHVEVDAEHHLDVVRRLGVLRTPTTLILDASGREVTRAAGAPTRQQVQAAVALASGDGG